jgi:cytochrome c oxidase cbb3-type subunit 2
MKLEKSAIFTFLGILVLFSTAIIVTLVAPRFVDPSWTTPTNPYQVQMYEIVDPNLYISSNNEGSRFHVYHVKEGFTLLSFQEGNLIKIIAPEELEKYVTKPGDKKIKLTSRLLLLKKASLEKIAEWQHKNSENVKDREFFELYEPKGEKEAFVIAPTDSFIENWVDENFILMDEMKKEKYHYDSGVVYVKNPKNFLIKYFEQGDKKFWNFSTEGHEIKNLEELKSHPLAFISRQELIRKGEEIYAIEGCWYCHSDQTRTLVQDVVANGSDSYPAPPSSANEYIYQKVTFLSTRRIGPDLSRVGIKRPSRDWHKAHFWAPKTASSGSIMPSFRHFFDNDPRGTSPEKMGIPNYKFEAIFQYLMTKGTRITPPTQSWWLGKDPVKTKDIIEGMRK